LVAKSFKQHPDVTAVELFGSFARGNRRGRDVDLILIVSRSEGDAYLEATDIASGEALQKVLQMDMVAMFRTAWQTPEQNRKTRRDIAISILGEQFSQIVEAAERYLGGREYLDILVFPIDWRDRIEDISEQYPGWRFSFLRDLAREAIII
jgi:predicted nucleotidyltransferase